MIQFDKQLLEQYTFIDLFAGIGGFRIALESLGARCVYSNEINKKAQQTYIANFGELNSDDITKVAIEDIPDHDILCAGFPCQPFSISGKQQGFNDTRGTLFFNILRIIQVKRPKVVFLENVKNLLTHNHHSTLNFMKQALINLNYDVYFKVLDASQLGVPQKRERLYIVCFNREIAVSNFTFPNPIPLQTHVKDYLLTQDSELDSLYLSNQIKVTYDQHKQDVDFSKLVRVGIVNKGGQGERIYDVNGVGITLSATGGGIFARTGGYLINGRIRKLHPRECARLMGFPDSYQLPTSKNIAYQQLGNSVVINVLQLIAYEIAQALSSNKNHC